MNNAQSTAATSQIDNATTVAGVTAAQNTANELNTAMGQLQNGINDQNTVKQQVNFTDADQGKKYLTQMLLRMLKVLDVTKRSKYDKSTS